MKKLLKKKKGFTLIELLICLFIIGLMMLLIIPNIAKQREKAQEKSDAAIVKVIENQQELYLLDNKDAKGSTEGTSSTDAKPSAETLQSKAYITKKQLEAYKKANKNSAQSLSLRRNFYEISCIYARRATRFIQYSNYLIMVSSSGYSGFWRNVSRKSIY